MHRDLKKLLQNAEGISGFIVAIFIDVRGFSSFAKLAESSEAAVFLRRVYTEVLDQYFPDASFFKPTGDGLLLIKSYDGDSLAEVVNSCVRTSLQLVTDFPNLCANDPMINFTVPEHLGVGLARGAATSLVSDGKTLDYSGRPLNLAARLMDVARPSGVVFDAAFGYDLLEDEVAEPFRSEDIYIRGIAEEEPLTVYYSQDVKLTKAHKKPIGKKQWVVDGGETLKFRELKQRGLFLYTLQHEPLDPSGIEVAIAHPKVLSSGRPHKSMRTLPTYKAKYRDDAGTPRAQVDFRRIVRELEEKGVKDSWDIKVDLKYLVA